MSLTGFKAAHSAGVVAAASTASEVLAYNHNMMPLSIWSTLYCKLRALANILCKLALKYRGIWPVRSGADLLLDTYAAHLQCRSSC